MSSTSETPRSVELGIRLRTFRKRANLSQEELGEQLGRRHTHISRWESGKLPMTAVELGSVLGILGVTGAERDEVLGLHSAAADLNWMSNGVDKQLSLVRAYEDAATRIVNVQPQLVPGPLQTRGYALDVMLAVGSTLAEAQAGTDFRMERAEKILDGGVEYEAIIGEYALRHPACEVDAAPEQLRHLLKVADLPHVTIRVTANLVAGYTPMRQGSFVLIESSKPVVHLEQLGGSTTLADARYVRPYKNAADILRRDAMSPAATAELIAGLIDDWSVQHERKELA
jgi:transcriptional regulator with XRE-family HTH domain